MANSSRIFKDKNGDIFMPMNLEGDASKELFITPFKLVCIVAILLALIYNIGYLSSINAKPLGWIVYMVIWFVPSQLVLRKIVFEEKYYLANYREMMRNKKSTPALFWAIASFENSDAGCIMNYMDGKIAIVIKLERDTIVGKPKDFEEAHYDGISDFYRDLNLLNYKYIHANVMEEAGNDTRLGELDKLVYQDDNRNVQKLMEYMVGHTKKITRRALYETDYILIYTEDKNRIDSIIDDVENCAGNLLNGAFSGFVVLLKEELTDLVKDENGVKYFNPTEATLRMFDREGSKIRSPFKIAELQFSNGTSIEIDKGNESVLREIQSKLKENIGAEIEIEKQLREVVSDKQRVKEKKLNSILKVMDESLLDNVNNELYNKENENSFEEEVFTVDDEDDELIDF